jgi:hypothetical protein
MMFQKDKTLCLLAMAHTMSDPRVESWKQSGRLYLWRYGQNTKNYPGWNLASDETGWQSISDLLERMAESTRDSRREISVAAPTALTLSVPNNRAGSNGLVCPVVRISLGLGSAIFLYLNGSVMAEKLTAIGYALIMQGVLCLLVALASIFVKTIPRTLCVLNCHAHRTMKPSELAAWIGILAALLMLSPLVLAFRLAGRQKGKSRDPELLRFRAEADAMIKTDTALPDDVFAP